MKKENVYVSTAMLHKKAKFYLPFSKEKVSRSFSMREMQNISKLGIST